MAAKLRDAAPAKLNELEKLHGFHRNEFSILLDDQLAYRAVYVTFYDWMHTWCIDGVYLRAFRSVQAHLRAAAKPIHSDFPPKAADLHDYMQRFAWPRQFADGKRIFESGELNSGSASQVVAAAPVIAKYFRDVVKPVAAAAGAAASCQDAIDVLLYASRIIELLAGAGKGHAEASLLRDRTFHFMREYQRVFGEDADWTLKFHLAMDIALQWHALVSEATAAGEDDDETPLPNCFALERKHKSVKAHMKEKLSIISQERSVLEDVVLDQLWSLKEGGPLGLMKPHKPSNKQLEELREEFPCCADAQVASG